MLYFHRRFCCGSEYLPRVGKELLPRVSFFFTLNQDHAGASVIKRSL